MDKFMNLLVDTFCDPTFIISAGLLLVGVLIGMMCGYRMKEREMMVERINELEAKNNIN